MLRPSAALILIFAAGCSGGAPLTQESLASAIQVWSQHAWEDYDMQLELRGDRIENGTFEVEVRGGKPTKLIRNGQPVTKVDPFYSVDGLFLLLHDELGFAQHPDRFWGAEKGARVKQRANFDATLGYPRTYLRAVVGTQQNIAVHVKSLRRVTPTSLP